MASNNACQCNHGTWDSIEHAKHHWGKLILHDVCPSNPGQTMPCSMALCIALQPRSLLCLAFQSNLSTLPPKPSIKTQVRRHLRAQQKLDQCCSLLLARKCSIVFKTLGTSSSPSLLCPRHQSSQVHLQVGLLLRPEHSNVARVRFLPKRAVELGSRRCFPVPVATGATFSRTEWARASSAFCCNDNCRSPSTTEDNHRVNDECDLDAAFATLGFLLPELRGIEVQAASASAGSRSFCSRSRASARATHCVPLWAHERSA